MATREEFNKCMIPHISGKDKTKEERKMGFCVGAKLCSGKAQTEEEAIAICNQPKQVAVVDGSAEERVAAVAVSAPCPERIKQVHDNLSSISRYIREGKTQEADPLIQTAIKEIHECGSDVMKKLIDDIYKDYLSLRKMEDKSNGG